MSDRRWLPLGVTLVVTAAAAAGLGATCGPGPQPSSDTCQVPAGAPSPTIAGIEIGHLVDGQFVAFTDHQVATLVTGGQGFEMIVAALRVTGSGVGDCLGQMTWLEDDQGQVQSSEEAGLVTHADGPGAWVTGDILLPYYSGYGRLAVLRSQIGNMTARVSVWIEFEGEIDAGIDTPSDGCVALCGQDGPAPPDAVGFAVP